MHLEYVCLYVADDRKGSFEGPRVPLILPTNRLIKKPTSNNTLIINYFEYKYLCHMIDPCAYCLILQLTRQRLNLMITGVQWITLSPSSLYISLENRHMTTRLFSIKFIMSR